MVNFVENERRLHTRNILSTKIEFYIESDFFTGNSKNISMNGMMVESNRTLETGKEVNLKFSFPPITIPLEIKGQVVWTGNGLMGIKFKNAMY